MSQFNSNQPAVKQGFVVPARTQSSGATVGGVNSTTMFPTQSAKPPGFGSRPGTTPPSQQQQQANAMANSHAHDNNNAHKHAESSAQAGASPTPASSPSSTVSSLPKNPGRWVPSSQRKKGGDGCFWGLPRAGERRRRRGTEGQGVTRSPRAIWCWWWCR